MRVRFLGLFSQLAACSALWACGGNSGPPSGPELPSPVTQTLSSAGGAISVAGADGGRLTLELPAGALRAETVFTLTPLASEVGAVAQFSIAPAGLLLQQPATLRYARAGTLPERSHFFWTNVEGRSVLATRAGSEGLEAKVVYLGYAAERSSALRAVAGLRATRQGQSEQGQSGATVVVAPLDCATKIPELRAKLLTEAPTATLARARQLFDELEAVNMACSKEEVASLEADACAAYQRELIRARAAPVESVQTFNEVSAALVGATAHVEVTGAECSVEATDEALVALMGRLIDFFRRRMAEPGFAADLLDRRLSELLGYHVVCQTMGLGDVCERFATDLYPPMLDLLRQDAYQDCLSEGTALALSQLYLGGKEVESEGPFFGYGRFTLDDLEADLSHCTNPTWDIQVFRDAATVPELVPELGLIHESRGVLGAPIDTATVTVPRGSGVTVGGRVRVLVCPSAALASDELVFRIGGVEITRRQRVDNLYAISGRPADIVLDRDLPLARLDPAAAPSFALEIFREGDGCAGLFREAFKVLTLHVLIERPTLKIAPATARLEPGETRQFSALLDGRPTANVRWEAAGGTISAGGSYTAGSSAGTFEVRATSQVDSTLTATAAVTIEQGQQAFHRWGGTLGLGYSFSVEWNLTKPGCDAGLPGVCTSRHTGSYAGSAQIELAVETGTELSPAASVDVVASSRAGATGQATGSSAVDSRRENDACIESGTVTVQSPLSLAGELGLIEANFGRLQVSTAGELRWGAGLALPLSYSGTETGRIQSTRSAACPGGAGTFEEDTTPFQRNVVARTILGVFEGTAVLTNPRIQGTSSISGQFSGATCESFILDIPNIGGVSEPNLFNSTGTITCTATLTGTWDLGRI